MVDDPIRKCTGVLFRLSKHLLLHIEREGRLTDRAAWVVGRIPPIAREFHLNRKLPIRLCNCIGYSGDPLSI